MRDAFDSWRMERPLSRRATVRSGLGALTAIAGLGAAQSMVTAQSSNDGAEFCPAFGGSKRARNAQPEADFENDAYEVYQAPWGEYEIWPMSSPPTDPAWVSLGFRGTYHECEAYISTLPAPKPMFEF